MVRALLLFLLVCQVQVELIKGFTSPSRSKSCSAKNKSSSFSKLRTTKSVAATATATTATATADNTDNENGMEEHDWYDTQSSETSNVRFDNFDIPQKHVFYETPLSVAFVHCLSPVIKAGHVLVVSKRIIPSVKNLSDDEYTDLCAAIQKVKSALEKHYGGTSFNVVTQWGSSLTVPHVHVHILPTGEFERSDDVYAALQTWTPRAVIQQTKSSSSSNNDDDDNNDRNASTVNSLLADEAALYRAYFS